MEETKQDIEVVVGEEVVERIGADGKPVITDEHGRFVPGVYQGRGFRDNPENINRKGRPKGTDWSSIQDKIFSEKLAGMTDEEFMIEQIKKAHTGDKNALKFVSQFMKKPPKESKKEIQHKFVLPNTLSRKMNPQLDSGNESDEEYDG